MSEPNSPEESGKKPDKNTILKAIRFLSPTEEEKDTSTDDQIIADLAKKYKKEKEGK